MVQTESGRQSEVKVIPTKNRSTNTAPLSEQIGGTCYAHAAAAAYHNVCERMFGCDVPSFEDCLKIATVKVCSD